MDAVGASSSSSCSLSTLEKYDVFLSFRGEDTRDKFISHLYTALNREKIKTYIDEKSLESGEEIASALLAAIEKSKISIIVFSKDYVSSSCLNELVHILESHRENKQMVIPIFYEVDPSHISKQEGIYGEAFLKHEERFKDRANIMQNWRGALTESANLSGWDSRVTRPESILIEAIVNDILRKLNRGRSNDIDYKDLIGLEEHIQKIEMLLSFGLPDVRVVGIWGLGGVGKTTLAGVLFNKYSNQFESHCFLANVGEDSEKLRLITLRNKLLGELLEGENMNLGTLFSLPPQVKERLRRKKVLVVLDDVKDSEQLQVLVGDRDLFGNESRVIITTRDAKVLKNIEPDMIYRVEELDDFDALQLFKLKAFRGSSPTRDYVKLSKEVVKYAGGVPLVITTLASRFRSLHPQSIQNWEMILDDLKQVSHDDIQKKLRISYDGLNRKEKTIFLDIACFLKGESRGIAENVLNDHVFGATMVIDDLIDKSLITINSGRLWMHDLVQEMGWKVVQHQSEEQPGQQNWFIKDAQRILNKNNEEAKHNQQTSKKGHVILVGPWGAKVTSPSDLKDFDEGPYTGIREINFEYNNKTAIGGFQVIYDLNGRPHEAEKHSSFITGFTPVKISLDFPNEYIVEVRGYIGKVQGYTTIRSLTFKTNMETYGPYGPTRDIPFSLPIEKGLVVGFKGSIGYWLDYFSIYLSVKDYE